MSRVLWQVQKRNSYLFIADCSIDTHENFWILDEKDCKIKKYDKNGKEIGRKGRGPGEFVLPEK